MSAYIQTVAMAWLSLGSEEAKKISFLWTTAVDCVSRAARHWSQNFYQESQKTSLRCLAKNICKEIKANIGFQGIAICNECSFFDRRMSLQELRLFNEAVMEAGNYQKLATKFEKTNGLKGHFIEFEGDDQQREVLDEQEISQRFAVEELRRTVVILENFEKKKKEGKIMEEQERTKKKGGGPVGPCEVFLNGKSVWKEVCHWSVARKQARCIKAEEAGEIDVVELFEGEKLIPSEKWDKNLVLIPKKKEDSAVKEKKPKETATKEKDIPVPIRPNGAKLYKKFVLESVVWGDEITKEESVSKKLFFQEIPEQEIRELLKKGFGLV